MTDKVGKFASLFHATQLGKREWVLESDLIFIDPVQGKLTVPKMSETNLASINSLRYVAPLLYALLVGYGNAACSLHDYLYKEARLSRKKCDDVLYRALRAEGVAKWRASLFWTGVRVFGASHYGGSDDDESMGSSALTV